VFPLLVQITCSIQNSWCVGLGCYSHCMVPVYLCHHHTHTHTHKPNICHMYLTHPFPTASLPHFIPCPPHFLSMQAVPAAADAAAAGDQDSELLSPAEYRMKYSMWVHPPEAPAPLQTFNQAQLPPGLHKAVRQSAHKSARMSCLVK
jgi:hypothetical protein